MKRYILLSFLVVFVLIGILFLRIYQKNETTVLSASQKPEITSPLPQEKQGQIAFVSDRTGNQEIYIMDLDTLLTENITNSPGDDMNPQVAPDGRTIVFYSNRNGNNQIYQMDLKSHEVTRLTNNTHEDYDPSYSPDGKYIVFKSNRDDKLGDIFIMNQDGSNQVNITPTRGFTEEWSPKFSVDGEQIIFTVRSNKDHLTDELYTMNTDGSGAEQITENDVPDWYPSVNPIDGSIVYISKGFENALDNIYKLKLSDHTRILLTTLPGNDADPSWSLDGKRVVFINDNDKDYDLYIMKADGTGVRKIQDTPNDELSPIFLPPITY